MMKRAEANTKPATGKPATGKTTMGAALLLSAAMAAAVFIATPALAKKNHHHHRTYHGHYYSGNGGPYQRDYSGYMTPGSPHYDPEFQRNRENFGFSGRDPSRPGGMDPSLHPPGRI